MNDYFPGVKLPYHDAPEDEPVELVPHAGAATDLAAVSYTLERLVEQQASVALGYGVHPALCKLRAQQVLALWLETLEIAERPRAPLDGAM